MGEFKNSKDEKPFFLKRKANLAFSKDIEKLVVYLGRIPPKV